MKTTDGKQMLTWVIYPPQFDPNKKYPTLLFCEGGPQSPVSQFWSYRWNFQIMAANDYIIVAPNRRGLPGFGVEWNVDELSLLKVTHIQSGNINVSKRQYEVRAALRNLLEYRRYGKIRNYHTPWFKDLPWVESFRAITEDFISHLRSQNSKPETIVNYERTLKRITNHLHSVGVDSFRDMTASGAYLIFLLYIYSGILLRNLCATLCHQFYLRK